MTLPTISAFVFSFTMPWYQWQQVIAGYSRKKNAHSLEAHIGKLHDGKVVFDMITCREDLKSHTERLTCTIKVDADIPAMEAQCVAYKVVEYLAELTYTEQIEEA